MLSDSYMRLAPFAQWSIVAIAGICTAAMVPCDGPTASAPPRKAERAAVAGQREPKFKQGISGTIRDEFGAPVAGALVVPRSLQRPGPAIPELAVLSDDSGRYAWPLPSGTYDLVVTAEGHQTAQRRGSVTEGGLTTLDVVLPRAR